jgi:hypothetical protein
VRQGDLDDPLVVVQLVSMPSEVAGQQLDIKNPSTDERFVHQVGYAACGEQLGSTLRVIDRQP